MFSGKTILLTGGSGGLGSLIGTQLTAEGARVVVLDRAAPATCTEFLQHDISTVEGVEAAAAAITGQDWDIVINLAGIQHFGPFERQSPEHLLASYMVNLVAPVRLTQAVLPGMKARGRGQIVNVGSIFGSINFAHFVTYSSAKAGLRGFSQALRRELSGSGLEVTYVAPRAVRTALNTPAVMEFAKLTQMNMDPPELIARRIIEAIRGRRKDVYFGFPESLFVRLNAVFPQLIDRALSANDRKAARLFAN
ncbi:SDR family NAD(P)-dependent oxidoreductase [Caulobacter henricii]|uniref:Short-chain dehydrogenase n=1 Tax=Caulobacter henricii TaxID=69395 RepID=A0A0P0P339_9CAUL|nr:SDR family NAD(P)-dependent oxidoreductase [Caulobacter henricii]ALL14800.1 short-chain dehydrogenase [Caulobacter henricii]